MEGATCIVQEDFLEEFLHTDPRNYIQPSTNEVVAGEVADMKGVTCIMQEDFPISMPLPLTTIQECNLTLPSLFSLEQLELIFDIRSYMADQLQRDTLINNHIDMLIDAFSNAASTQRCLTYVQPFILQPNDDILYSGSSNDRFHGPQIPPNV
jgi:hypothetical protein